MRERITWAERMMLATASFFFEKKNGYSVPFSGELLRTLGMAKMREFASLSEPILQRSARVFGDRDAQLLCSLSALSNGCSFCAVGHLLAANLIHLRDQGALFALHETDVAAWRKLRDSEFSEVLRHTLEQREPQAWRRASRLFALRDQRVQPSDEEDRAMVDLMALWGVITECSVQFERPVDAVPALHTVAKDRALLLRYRQLRASKP